MASTLLLTSLKHPILARNPARSCSQTVRCILQVLSQDESGRGANLHGKHAWPAPSLSLPFKPRGRRFSGKRSIFTSCAVERQGVELEVAVAVEGKPLDGQRSIVEDIANALQEDALQALHEALEWKKAQTPERESQIEMVELSVVLCDDPHIAKLNKQWRGIGSPTDVLSFPLHSEDDDQFYALKDIPICTLGDMVISIDTADRQAQERKTTLLAECRILLLHGLLHLMGLDHDRSPKDWEQMAAAEKSLMEALGWEGKGLIGSTSGTNLHADMGIEDPERIRGGSPLVYCAGNRHNIELIALDMDGTLLNSQSQILPSSKEAILAAISKGIKVMLATGKARPAALAACEKVGLAGEGLVVSKSGPGVFLQGLAVHDWSGSALAGSNLSFEFVASVFKYSEKNSVPCIAFLGDDCATMEMTPEVEEMHTVYYEPLAEVQTLTKILSGPPVKKMLLVAGPDRINEVIEPHWTQKVQGTNASVMKAVESHLELVPKGVNKWNGLKNVVEMADIPMQSVLSIGDGGNDLQMVNGTGIGVAMGNATEEVKAVATAVVASNDDDGLAEALEQFVL